MNIQFASIVIFSFYITLCQAAIPGVVDCSTRKFYQYYFYSVYLSLKQG